MFAFSKAEIKKLASSVQVYNRGVDYYLRGAVDKLSFSEQDKAIRAVVFGNEDYDVEIYLDEAGNIDDMACDCPAFYEYYGACKHIVAVLLKAFDLWEEGPSGASARPSTDRRVVPKMKERNVAPKEDPRLQVTRSLVASILETRRPETVKTPVHLRVTLYKDPTSYGVPFVELEIGLSRLYVVPRITDLLEALHTKRELYFGKTFTLRPQENSFLPQDQPFVEMMLEAYLDERGYYAPYSSTFFKRSFKLNPSRFRRFLEIAGRMENVVWKRNYNDPPQQLKVCPDLPPVALRIAQREHHIELVFQREADIYALTPAKDVLFTGDCFYLPPPEKLRVFFPILEAFTGVTDHKLPITDEDTVAFIAEAAPVLETVCPVAIAPEIAARLHKEPLLISLWLDKTEDGISAKVVFTYGTEEINPLVNAGNHSTGRLLLRETGKEACFLQILKEAGFTVQGDTYTMSDEERIFNFLRDLLPEITNQAEVYYSEAFRSLQIRRLPRFSGGIRLNEENDLLDVSLQFEGLDEEELKDFIRALREKKKYFRLKNNAFIPLDRPEPLTIAKLLDELGLTEKEIAGKVVSLPKYKALSLDQAVRELGREKFQLSPSFKQMVHEVRDPQEKDWEVPSGLAGILRDYQKAGFKWLKTLSHYGFGGILADDMGLGKTLQVIALVASDYHEDRLPSLVIAPTSLVYNWQEEIAKFAPDLPTVVIGGNKEERLRLLAKAPEAAFLITSYPLIRRDIEDMESISFKYCFIDEAQHIKNPETINAKAAKRVKARRYFAVTGTPIENSLTELWSIFDFIMPGYLSTHRKFQSRYEIPIVKNKDRDALEDLGRRIRPFILRRMKKDVLTELPEKIETKAVCEMTEAQKTVYAAYLAQARSEFEEEIGRNGFQKSQIKILALLTRLRQICCHPALFLEKYTGGSGKLDLLRELIEDSLAGGHRVLLFSQFVSMLELIEDELKKDGIRSLRIDGETPPDERLKRVNSFNGGVGDIFLISLKAGGTGLNLTGADMVVHYDPWWNPAVEDQATDRAYRLGQKNAVQVYKLVTRGTIEEKIYLLQQRKKELVEAVIQPGGNFFGKLTLEEIRSLFED